jgi:hypothetical protein
MIDKADLYKNTVFVSGGNLDAEYKGDSPDRKIEEVQHPAIGFVKKTARKNFTMNSDVKVGGQIFASDQSL